MHVSMLSPRRGGTPGIVEHLTSIAFHTLGNLAKNLGARVGPFAFFIAEEWNQGTSSQVLICVPANVE